MKLRGYLALIAFIILPFQACKQKNSNTISNFDSYLFVGTYTSDTSKGINIYKFNSETGESKYISETEVLDPSYLTTDNRGEYLYAISEGDEHTSKITAYKIDKKEGKLNFINEQKSGIGPCFITIDKEKERLVTADYGGGSISYLSISNSTGGIYPPIVKTFEGKGTHPERQTRSHVHNTIFSPDERFLFVNDLGTDKIYRFEVDKNAEADFLKQTPPLAFEIERGSGPRHTTFHPNGKFAYLITEISGEVISFKYDSNHGLFTKLQTIKADSLDAQGSADIRITPNGEFLYVSNRLKGDGLAIFSINQETGLLTKIGYQATGIHPRNFTITPNGKFLLVANRDSNNIQVFEIKENGSLMDINKNIELSMPVCLHLTSLN